MFELTIETKGSKSFIMAGVVKLAKFSSVEDATVALNDDKEHYTYWASSASVSVQNAKAKQVNL